MGPPAPCAAAGVYAGVYALDLSFPTGKTGGPCLDLSSDS